MGNDDPTLADLGEFSVIDSLVSGRRQSAGVLIGPGDDAALLAASGGRVLVSTDMLVEGRHFRLDWSSSYDVGRKAIAQNAADIEAMGGEVTGFVVAFGAPADTPHARVAELTDGMWAEAARVGAGVAGGDLVTSPQWVVSVTVLGGLDNRRPVRRNGARAPAVVAVAGRLGCSAAGYGLLERFGTGGGPDDREDFATLRQRHRVPEPPYGQGRVAAEAGALAMTDVSDGLLADLGHVAAASGVEIDVSTRALAGYRDALAGAAAALGADPWEWVLSGGEDHALVACFAGTPPAGWTVIGTVIGEVTGSPGGPGRVVVDGRRWDGPVGWQSYA
ncbi:thiamine-phosphate kinase [Mycolicibacterium palauense]|uniref:thiamine-phosphate kinase n=1 Tax=Mycolicibacterium palauense TaxID=2034511 RepID=UPI000BFF142E|nr:thiamine-phosphate kinase [Mycolicibacterium palauense]